LHKHIRVEQQRCYYAAQQAADVRTAAGVVITQDFTTIELGANVSATLSERAAAKIRTLIMAIETGDKQHHHRVFLCSNDESESSDFFFLRAAWYQLLRQDSSYTPPIDMTVRSAKRVDVWSDGASGQFKQRYALMMFYNLLRLGGGLVPFRVNFLAPGHGHSLADACAARLKQAANRLLLRREGDRAAGVLFSVASPTLLQFATHASKHLRNTTISLLGAIDRDEALRPDQRAFTGMKSYFSFVGSRRK